MRGTTRKDREEGSKEGGQGSCRGVDEDREDYTMM